MYPQKTQKRTVTVLLMLAIFAATSLPASAQVVLSLDSCRQMALRQNKEIAVAGVEVKRAKMERKSAFGHYLPKVSLTAGYIHTGREISLLNDDQKNALNNMGTNLVGAITSPLQTEIQKIIKQHPDLAPLIQQHMGSFNEGLNNFGQSLNNAGHAVTDAFRTDTRNMAGGAILLTQPLYMGGKIAAYNRITGYSEYIAGQRLRAEQQDIILDVDKAYWQVVSLVSKHKLATSYRDMLQQLESDVKKMVAEGVATRSNELNVSVKLNEAEMTLSKVEDGLVLSRMLLCQLCGLPLDTNPSLVDELTDEISTDAVDVIPDVETAMSERPELCMLEKAESIYKEKIKVERSKILPNLALTAGYMLTNPSTYNGFEKKFRYNWSVGVMLTLPIFDWTAYHKIDAARAEATISRLRTEEAREKIALQVTQSAFNVNEANRKYDLSKHNLEKAGENLRVADLGFHEGIITTSDLLMAQTAWVQAMSEKIDAQIDIRLTRAIYNKALGY